MPEQDLLPHNCPTCIMGRSIDTIREAVDDLAHAADAWLDQSEETSMGFWYLVGEVERIAALTNSRRTRKKLLEAVRIAKS